jgi:hypothetical protein
MRAMRRRRRRARSAGRGWRRATLPPLAWALIGLTVFALANYLWQVARKPTELLGLIVPPAPKTPPSTWSEYGPLFAEHSTEVLRPELLAALVQVESAGDPLARTYWRWRWRWNPFEIYAPASSAVGILQITDGTFAEARRLCIRDHEVAREGSWLDPRACWFNGFYFRTVPSHAIEMTSARLHLIVEETVAEQRASRATLDDRQRLAAVIHLCGRARGRAYAARGFCAAPGERCGDHDLARYVARVQALKAEFARMAAAR